MSVCPNPQNYTDEYGEIDWDDYFDDLDKCEEEALQYEREKDFDEVSH
jgi:hypothetical protein